MASPLPFAMKNQLSNGPIQEEASEEKLLSSGGPTQFGSIFCPLLGGTISL